MLLQVTDEYGHDCGFLGNPFINNCNYSTAYNLLNHIYGDIKMGSSASFKVENVCNLHGSTTYSNKNNFLFFNLAHLVIF